MSIVVDDVLVVRELYEQHTHTHTQRVNFGRNVPSFNTMSVYVITHKKGESNRPEASRLEIRPPLMDIVM